MGQIIRLNTVFANKNLPVIMSRDTAELEAEILRLPTLRAFWDFSDVSTHTLNSTKITKVLDKTTNANHLIADSGTEPMLDNNALNGVPSALMNGVAFMKSERTFPVSSWKGITMVAFAMKSTTTTPTNSMLMSGQVNNHLTLYVRNSDIAINTATVNLAPKNGVIGKALPIIASSDFGRKTSTIRIDGESKTEININELAKSMANQSMYVGRWADGASESIAGKFQGYVGCIMVFEGHLDGNHLACDLIFEYFRRKYQMSN